MRLCTFDCYPGHQDQIAIELGDGYVLISGIDTFWTMTCEGQEPKGISSCTLCIIRLGCFCYLESKSFYIAPRITDCPSSTSVEKIHGINLAYHHLFSTDVDLTTFTGATPFLASPEYGTKNIFTATPLFLALSVNKPPFTWI